MHHERVGDVLAGFLAGYWLWMGRYSDVPSALHATERLLRRPVGQRGRETVLGIARAGITRGDAPTGDDPGTPGASSGGGTGIEEPPRRRVAGRGSVKRAFLALGSNLGDRRALLAAAVAALDDVVAVSPVYETDPVGGPTQGPYLNVVVELRTESSARELLKVALEAEAAAGAGGAPLGAAHPGRGRAVGRG